MLERSQESKRKDGRRELAGLCSRSKMKMH